MTTKTRQRRAINANDPTTWAADLTRPVVDAASLGASDLIHIATIVGGSCRPAGTADGDTVATLASNGQHVGGGSSACLSTSADTVAIRLPIPNVSRPCEQCGSAFVARRPWARFCSAYCRRVAWLDRNPERAAELAERDKTRLRERIIANGGTWEEVH
jgi:hypothetical protein